MGRRPPCGQTPQQAITGIWCRALPAATMPCPNCHARRSVRRHSASAFRYNAGMIENAANVEPPVPAPKRKRRWLQFSLRSLMIVVTVLAVPCTYVVWQAKIVRERTAFRDVRCGFSWIGDDDAIPWLRRCLGGEPYKVLAIPLDSSKDLRDQAASLFP
jgi:hypothetical protein